MKEGILWHIAAVLVALLVGNQVGRLAMAVVALQGCAAALQCDDHAVELFVGSGLNASATATKNFALDN